MSQAGQLVDALKQCLKARGMTYRDLAAALGLSEATMKRNFAESSFSLGRLEAACRALDISIYDLAKLTRMRAADVPRQLTDAQERALAAEPVLLTYFYLLLTGWTPPRIGRRFGLDRAANDAWLGRLRDLGLVERLPRNRVRLLTGRRIEWRRGGPIRRLYEARVKAEFLQSRFDAADEVMRLETGELSAESVALLRRQIEQLARRVEEHAELDIARPAEDKRAYALMLAFRPWTFWSLVEVPPPGSEKRPGHAD